MLDSQLTWIQYWFASSTQIEVESKDYMRTALLRQGICGLPVVSQKQYTIGGVPTLPTN